MGISRGEACFWAAAILISACRGSPAEALSRSNAVMRAAPGAANGALASFRVKPGFRIELVASEPMVCAPVAMAFDENGRLFVVEMRDYPAQSEARPHLGRIRLLESPDEHGVYQTSTTYAEDLRLPSAVACYGGGIFVAVTPEMRFFKSEDGQDDDLNRVVLSGFGGTNEVNPDALLNNFNWGLQHRFYGASGGLAGTITTSNWPGAPISLYRANFSIEPRTLQVFPEAGPSQSGFCFDSFGRAFGCDFEHPLRVAMYEPRYTLRNPFYPRPESMVDAASPATAIYRAVASGGNMAAPPWNGTAPETTGLPETNRLARAWLTRACGCAVYRGGAFPTNYFGNVFVAAPEAHAVHRFVLREQGLEVAADRAPDESSTEFLLSEDASFRPVQVVNGPDGALYVADRQEGPERGRIYRIVPNGFKQPASPRLGKARTYELAAALAQGNGWQMETAARLLYEQHDPASPRLLTNMVARAPTPLARLQALHALEALGALDQSSVLRGLRDPDFSVREHAVLLSEKLSVNGSVPAEVWQQLKVMSADSSIRVRCQLAFTLGELRRPDRLLVLAQILLRDPSNRWIQNAVLSSVAEGAGALFALLANDARFATDPAGEEFLRQLAAMVGTRGRLDEVEQVMAVLARAALPDPETFGLGFALGEGLRRTRSSFALVDTGRTLAGLYTLALTAAIKASVPERTRVAAVQFLSVSPYTFDDVSDWLLLLCNPHPLTDLRSAALEALGRYDDPRVLPALLDRWPVLSPLLRNQAIGILLSRTNRVAAVLAAAQTGRIDAASFSSAQLNFLRTYRDPVLRDRALRLLGPVPMRRAEVTQQFNSALSLNGVADRGRQIFQWRCANCHRLGGLGQAVGLDLNGAKTQGKEKLLVAILEPNAAVRPEFRTWVLQTHRGENLVGILVDDNAVTVTLKQPGGVQKVWPRLNLESLEPQSWSLMPDGLEQGMTPQDMADLLGYLLSAP